MRRLAELLKTGFYSSRRVGMNLAIASLLVLTFFAFSSFAQAQGIVASDFEDGQMDGWVQNGNPTILQVSTDMAHTGTHSLKIAGRTQTYDGVSMDFLNLMKAGEAWEFTVWVRLAPGQAPDTIALQFHDPTTGVWGGYPLATNQPTVTDAAWVQVKGRYPDPANPPFAGGGSELKLYFTTGKGSTEFYADDFVAYKQQPSGCSNPADTSGVQTGFETGLEGWTSRAWSNATVSQTNADAHSGTYSLLESTRTGSWTVGVYDATGKLCNGSRYIIDVWAKMAPGMPDAKMSLTGELKNNGSSTYPTFISSQTVTANGWVEFKTTYDMVSDYDTLTVFLQPESDASSNFYVDDFSFTYVPPATTIEQLPSIATAYKTAFPVGAAVYAPDVTASDAHADLLALHFNSVTPENDMKWSITEPAENAFDYTKADAIVSFAKNHNMAVRGHTLVWHQQTPDWVFKDANGVDMSTQPYSDANKALLFGRMKNHIQSLITHFGADVASWDVVNEAFDESQTDGFRHSKWYIIAGGPSYIDEAFKDAKEAVDAAGLTGKVKLYLNDYNTTVPGKLSSITSYLTAAKAASVPVDGVGHQFHNKLDWPINDDPTSINAVTGAINAVSSLGFDNQVTEMDISIYRNAPGQTTYQAYADIVANLQNDLTIQGYRYHDYFATFKQLATAGKLSSVTLWGEADDHTWLTTLSKADAPLPFDNDMVHKPAYTGIMDSTALPNALPYANNADVKVSFNTATAVPLPASDSNLDPLTFTIVTAPAQGTLSAVTGNTVTYTPSTGYFGEDSFTFTANDGKGDSNLGQINITVLPAVPVAQDMSVTVNTNVAKAIPLVATGDGTFTWTILSQPGHGTLTGTAPNLNYTPATDYQGPDSFTFKVNNSLDSNVATVSINVVLGAPVANDQSVTTNFNTAKPITLEATGFGTITYAVVAQPTHGTLSGTAPNVAYTPTKDYWGSDSFTFKANNGSDGNVATVSITVLPDLPVAKDQSITVDYLTPTPIKLMATGSGTFTYTIVKMPKGKGTLTPTSQPDTFIYMNDPATDPYMNTPPLDVNLDSITFKVNNGHESQVATVSITVKPAALKVNLAAGQPASQAISAGGTATYNLQAQGYMNYSQHSMPGVTFVCGGVPNFATCTVTPNGATLDDKMTPVPFTVTIKTNTGATASAASTSPGSWTRTPWIAISFFATFALALLMISKTKLQWRLVGASAVLVVVASIASCGGGSTQSKTGNDTVSTPAGTYNITVTAVATRNISGVPQSDWKITGGIPLTLKVN